MNLAKSRLGGVLVIAISAALMWWNWHVLLTERQYYIKLAVFGPIGIIGGFFLILFPQRSGKPKDTKERVVSLGVLGVGVIAGLLNWYLMDPLFFKM